MIFMILGFMGFGLYLLIKGDGPARIVGVLLIAIASVLVFLFWVALAVERPQAEPQDPTEEVEHV